MKRARCKNCEYAIFPKGGQMLCSMLKRPTNADGCCCEYRKRFSRYIGNMVVMAIAVIAFCVTMAKLLGNG